MFTDRDGLRELAPDVGHIGSEQIETQPLEVEAGAPLVKAAVAQSTQRLSEPHRNTRRGESPGLPAQRGSVNPLSPDRFSVNFTADNDFRKLLEEVRALLSHGAQGRSVERDEAWA